VNYPKFNLHSTLALAALTLVRFPAAAAGPPHAPAAPAPSTAAPATAGLDAATFDGQVRPLLVKYCYDCHSGEVGKGDVKFDTFKTAADVLAGRKTWETVLHHVYTREMPPADADIFPSTAERELIVTWIEKNLLHFDAARPDPGHVTFRRLNRSEYNNTIRDLVGVDFQPAEDFPADNSGFGFDNIGDVLSLSPLLMEKYLTAADRIFDQAIATETIPSTKRRYPANMLEFGFNADGDSGDGWMPLGALEEDGLSIRVPVSGGDYMVRVQAYAKGGGPLKLTCMIDDAITNVWAVTATSKDQPGVYEARVGVPSGKHKFFVLNHRVRGGANELVMKNGRIGQEQRGNIMVKWLEIEGPLPTATWRFPAKKLEVTGSGTNSPDGTRLLDANGEVAVKFTAPHEGDYLLRATAYARQAGDAPARMEFRAGGHALHTFDVLAPATLVPTKGQQVFSLVLLNAQPQVYETKVHLPAGEQRLSAAFTNPFADPKAENPNLRVRELTIQNLEIASLTEPQVLPAKPAPVQHLFALADAALAGHPAATPAGRARLIVADFTRRAWRRPVQPAEMDQLMALFALGQRDGLSFDQSLKLPLEAALVSPFFLFHGEVIPAVATVPAAGDAVPLGEFALASRLSYFLWSSMPDDELLDLAARGQLRANLGAQVQRLLASPKSQAFVENFAGQWLELRNLRFIAPDRELYPDFDENLRRAMEQETDLFFASIMHEDRSVLDFLNADYTFVNGRLAKHYGIAGVTGEDFQRVSLKDLPRRGVLTQASVLAITSNPTRTSPVKRGKWVLENLLGDPPPPPPPNVPELKNDGQPSGGTLRAQMEQHRADPVCASCHARMDPLGFGLENFDGIGAYRAKEGDFAVDASGKLASGETFHGAVDLTGILAGPKRDAFIRTLTEKMLTYALGRGIEYYDRPAVEKITTNLADHDLKFSALILGIVQSQPFQMQRAPETKVAANP
jgi:hypothetical protein